MIAEFTIENYRSFKEKRTFSLISTKDNDLSESNVFLCEKNLQLLKSAIIFGPNASGKTNFFLALNFFLYFSVRSGPNLQVDEPTGTEIFAFSRQSENSPSFFELIFFLPTEDNQKKIKYRYGLSLTDEKIVEEYLFAVYVAREVNLFNRKGQEITNTSYFKEGNRSKPFVRNNSSFLSVCAQNNGEISGTIIKYFMNIVISSGLFNDIFITGKKLSEIENYKTILNFLHNADIQITGIQSKIMKFKSRKDEAPPEIQAFLEYMKKNDPDFEEREAFYFGHRMFDGDKEIGEKFISIDNESDGTQKLFNYSLPILNALKNGTPVFIDEFDTSLHPLILRKILQMFNSTEYNINNAQLVISCHAIHIMTKELLRRDQIWFCKKDIYGASDLYSLANYKGSVRKDAAYNKNYLLGNYGAIPHINEILEQEGGEL